MKKYLLILSFLVSLSFAQHDGHGHGEGKHGEGPPTSVSGVVYDSLSDKPMSYVSVSLESVKDNQIETGGMSDNHGHFQLNGFKPGKYNLVIEFIGYEKHFVKDLAFNQESGIKHDLGKISLKLKNLVMDEITIIDDKPLYEFEADKMVYNAGEDISSINGTAGDVLNKVPMVIVDQDGDVTLRGNSNVKILVNGRQNRTGESENDVDNIPASLIERVEVITSPSAKYDPEGMAGIINIVLKKGKYEGFNGSMKIHGKHNTYHSFGAMNGISLYGNYKKNKFNFYSSYNNKTGHRNTEGQRYSYTTYQSVPASSDYSDNETPDDYTDDIGTPFLPEKTDSIDFKWYNDTERINHLFRLGTDYYIADDLFVNGEVNYSFHAKESRDTTTYYEPIYYADSKVEKDFNNNGDLEGVLGITKTFDNPEQEFSFFISNDIQNDNEYEILNWTDTTIFYQDINVNTIDISYKLPINEGSSIEIGYDGKINDNEEDANFELTYFDFIDCDETQDLCEGDEGWQDSMGNGYFNDGEEGNNRYLSGLNKFGYSRNIDGIYFEHSKKLNDKWSLKYGIRWESVHRNITFSSDYIKNYGCLDGSYYGEDPTCNSSCSEEDCALSTGNIYSQLLSDTPDSTYNTSYTKSYPSFHLTYNIDEKRNIQFGMSKRVDRPGDGGHGGGSRQIRPFPRDIYNENFIFIGNPYLKPEYSTQYEVSYKSPLPMGFFYTNIYFHSIDNVIEWYDEDMYESGDIVTFRNADTGKNYGIELWSMIAGQTIGGGYWHNTTEDGSDDVELNGFNEGYNLFMRINLPEKYIKIFGFEGGFYYMKMKTKYGSLFGDKGTIWANLGISKSFFNNRATLSFNVNNLFDAGGFSMNQNKPIDEEKIYGGYLEANELSYVASSRNGRTYSLSFKFNFGNLQEDKNKFKRRAHDHDGGGEMDMGY